MKTLNAKRISLIAAGAALLGLGVAFAGPITFSNVPIISATGQPLAQIVIGSSAQPIDGVSAGNIAAAIGNLAYASVPVTASVNQAQAANVLKVSVSSASGATVTNQQVWLNETGSGGAAAGSYQFGVLIGSVLNGAIILNALAQTKGLQGGSGTQYSYQESNSLTISPVSSPYYATGSVQAPTTPSAGYNGGGVSFSNGFTSTVSSVNWDNIMQISSTQLPALLNNVGSYGETSYLWLTGFPVFNQVSTVNQFQVESAGGAYQVIFNKPIQSFTSSGSLQINAPISLLRQNWTIINETVPGKLIGSQNIVYGGKLTIASSLAPLTTVYVGHNITSGPFAVQLTDLGQPNANGVSTASIAVYYNGVLTPNVTQLTPGTTKKFNVSGQILYINLNSTFAGLYAYQKWAKMQLYSNVYTLTDGQKFNQTTNPGWIVRLLWTNTTSTSPAQANALQSIVVYNQTPTSLQAGQSYSFIQSPAAYKVTFIGDTLGSGNFDNVQATTSTATNLQYQNLVGGVAATSVNGIVITNVSEAAQELTVTSQINNAFSYAGQTSSSVTYVLTPYSLTETGNNLLMTNGPNTIAATNVILLYTNVNGANWITSTQTLQVQLTGWTSNSQNSGTTIPTVQFTSNSQTISIPTNMYNVTGIQLQNRALPGALSITVKTYSTTGNSVTLATLSNEAPGALLNVQSGKVWAPLNLAAAGNVLYNQQNGQPTSTFILTQQGQPAAPTSTSGQVAQYFTYSMNEIAVPTNTAATDLLQFGIDNSTTGVGQYPMQINYSVANSLLGGISTSAGLRNNASYTSTAGGNAINVLPGFRSERGSKIAQITSTTDTFAIAKLVDTLQMAVGTSNTVISGKNYKLYGPYGVGQATNIANVSIGPVTASATLGAGSTYNITGISNIQATPSVTHSDVPVLLSAVSSTAPLVVLDSKAATAPQSNYILVGSGFVNSLSQQLQSAYNITFTPSSAPIMQSYGANRILIAGFYGNQTQTAANNFINQLYAQATV